MANKSRKSQESTIQTVKNKDHYVLMADMINSQSQSVKELKQLRSIVDKINNDFDLFSPLTITLGDEFQCITRSLFQSISIIFKIEEYIIVGKIPFKLRYALSYGKIDTKINSQIAHGMYGEALTHTREILEESKKSKRERIRLSLSDEKQEKILVDLLAVYQSLLDDWKLNDFEIVEHFYTSKDYKDVALALDKNRDQIWKREKNLKIREFFKLQNSILSIASLSKV